MRSRRVSKGNQRRQQGHKQGWEGPNSVQEDPKGKQKGGKRPPVGGAGSSQRFRRVAKGTQIGKFDNCYTVL